MTMTETSTQNRPAPSSRVKRPVYLDNQATTPVDTRVLDAMLPFFTEKFGNPHSVSHRYGWEAEAAVDQAREEVAGIIGAMPEEIIFTSGATEANNLAIKGLAHSYGDRRDHIVTAATEHKCVLESCRRLEREGFSVTYLPVDSGGFVDPGQVAAALNDRTLLVSVMAVNNEIGVIQPLEEIGRICRENRVLFHTDAAQAVGKIPLDVGAMSIDLMSVSGHKLYGPKGVGALYLRRASRARLTPILDGGGQEQGVRAGTLATPLCVGLGTACRIAEAEMATEQARLRRLSADFLNKVQTALPFARLNGDADRRIPGNINLSFPGLDGGRLIAEMRDLAVSSGAACASATDEPSYVLAALGLDESEIRAAIRFGLGRFTTEEEADFAADTVIACVNKLKAER